MIAGPQSALDDLVAAVPELDRDDQSAQLDALLDAGALGPGLHLDRATLDAWARWDAESGIVEEPPDVDEAFDLSR